MFIEPRFQILVSQENHSPAVLLLRLEAVVLWAINIVLLRSSEATVRNAPCARRSLHYILPHHA